MASVSLSLATAARALTHKAAPPGENVKNIGREGWLEPIYPMFTPIPWRNWSAVPAVPLYAILHGLRHLEHSLIRVFVHVPVFSLAIS